MIIIKDLYHGEIRCSIKKKEYFTLVSEFMLQQTQVKTVIPYFNSFLKNIPNFQSLAKVSEVQTPKTLAGSWLLFKSEKFKKKCKNDC